MVHRMGEAEPARAMEQPVGPIEETVVEQQIEKQADRQIPERPGVDVAIDAGPAMRLPAPGDDAGGQAVDRGDGEAPADLAPHLGAAPPLETRVPEARRQGDGAPRDTNRPPHASRPPTPGETQRTPR